ncbi:ras guanine nucleotide exchange factor domain-containing protein [Dichotomocladium elegans]|nr:ras guanine nucleotide exchange factor domain-containing protein [Dichotomocladium elegans]
MENVQSSLLSAEQLSEKGLVKDAYMAYLAIAEEALKTFYDIKFVSSAIVSQPKQYSAFISAMRTCLTHIEHIIETHSPTIVTTAPTEQPSSPRAATFSKMPPPPLPPKPPRIQQKPTIPPKPSRPAPSRPSSPPNTPLTDTPSSKVDTGHQLQVPMLQSPHTKRHTLTDNQHDHNPTAVPPSESAIERPVTVPHQPARPVVVIRPTKSEFQESSTMLDDTHIGMIEHGAIDPTHLAPAQMNAGDSLSPMTAAGHVPFIPTPPLLAAYRQQQAQLDALDATLKEYKIQKQELLTKTAGDVEEYELDQAILQYTKQASEVRQSLNRVRTLYMNAATIPTVLQFPAHLIAYQATLIESAIFCAIPPKALLEHSAKNPHARIVASTDFFNYITRIIEHSILLPQEASQRAQHINHWAKVASKCLELNNYQTLKAIVSALGTPPVQRLRRTWAYVPKKSMARLDSLNELMSESDNYGKYREHMGMVKADTVSIDGVGKSAAAVRADHYSKPTVPFLGTFIHDITYLVAAAKQAGIPPTQDPRVLETLQTMERFAQGPKYSLRPPSWFVKTTSSRHHFGLSSALQKGASRFSGSVFGFSERGSSDDNETVRDSLIEEDTLDEQQQMITQYLLMRSWVNQSTVDELSMLREPPRQQLQQGSPGARSSTPSYHHHRSTTGSTHNSNSVISNTSSSLMRFSTGSVSLSNGAGDSRGTSMEEVNSSSGYNSSYEGDAGGKQHQQGGFWPFRRSSERSSSETKSLPPESVLTHTTASVQNQAPHIPPRPPPRRVNED